MPGRDRLKEIVQEAVNEATDQAEFIASAAKQPSTATEDAVSDHAIAAKAAIDQAAEAAKILVREGG